ncbi:MAG: 4Fe-4S dicluster domain-containing protein [Deltaproteobacteria bacterium]|nr:MAG: 4Fe-4S dicluster domain-containing protein [Deltaproteobacteria bacterium]
MAQRGWHIDLTRCTGCNACTVACKFENNTYLPGPGEKGGPVNYRAVVKQEGGAFPNPVRRFISMSCMHCANPACLPACPVGAISKRASDGIVLIDENLCIGCRNCEWTCPYGAPQYNPKTGKVEKCHFCKDRIDAGLPPACVQTCVGDALHMLDDVTSPGGAVPEGFAPISMTNPSVVFEE